MAGEAAENGLRFQPHMLKPGEGVPAEWLDRAAACAPMSDSRQGVAAYYRYDPRPIARLCGFEDHSQKRNPKAKVTIDRPKIHESVFERIRDGRDSYAPFNLPDRYVVVTRKGEVLDGDPHPGNPTPNPFEHSTQAESRVREQQSAWNAVWLRRVVYFTTIATTLFLLALPMLPLPAVPDADASPTLKQFIGAIGGFFPGFAQSLLEKYQDRPGSFVIAASVVGLLLWCGSFLKEDINDRMLTVWAHRKGLKSKELVHIAPQPRDWIYRLREHPLYKGTFRFMSDKVWPNVFGVAILIVLFGAIPLRLIYQIASRTESFCKPNLEAPKFERLPVGANGDVLNTAEFRFYPADICRLAGLDLKAGQKYAIQIAIPIEPTVIEGATRKYDETKGCRGKVTGTDPKDVEYHKQFVGGWQDLTIPVTSTAGIPSSPIMSVFLPFRRIWGAGWFVPIAAIGTKLPERHYLVEPAIDFTPTRKGPLSVYVNDAAFPLGHFDDGWCLTWDCYYRNNSGGAAKVRVTEIDTNMRATSLKALTPFSCLEQIASAPTRK